MKNYKINRTIHLSKYNQGEPGIFCYKGTEVSRPHIMSIPDGKSQMDVILEILRCDEVIGEGDLFTSPQKYAHHLNSSQIVCYEFFRQMMDKNVITSRLSDFLHKKGNVPNEVILENCIGKFEYIPDYKEYTNFDYYIEGNGYKLYFEIKYTEDGFGRANNDDSFKKRFETIYARMIENCICLKSKDISENDFRRYYQLFRNVLRCTNCKEYVFFVFPRENDKVKSEFDNFYRCYIKPEWMSNVRAIHWEDCQDYMTERFYEKFFYGVTRK